VDLKGFLENHLYGTVTTALEESKACTLRPEKKALGNLANKKSLNFTGCSMSCMNFSFPVIIFKNY
jgi:hypothetical protein